MGAVAAQAARMGRAQLKAGGLNMSFMEVAAQAACRGWVRPEIEGRVCLERTLNMSLMVLTLDVSRLSGWLNADAFCQVETRAHDASEVWAAGGYREGGGCGGGGGASSAQGGV